ncbi:Leucine-rich PPR motif-containing protein, mitochondrial [Lamellibrachia satsuma]|nr:Leucine-rich PPR motif-containing protein, mitochondrial [Lamellibrachia satsuma]
MAALGKVARIVNLTAVRRLVGIPGTTGRGAFITSFFGDKLRLTEKRIPSVISRHLTAAAAIEHDRSVRGQTRPVPADTVSRQLQVLDLQVQRWGRVDSEEVTNIINLMQKAGEVSSQQALMVLRCLGALMVKEHPEARQKLFQQLWDKLPQLGVTYNVSHYNAALRVQLENGVKVNAADFLANMENNQIIPNRITYQLLIACYCENGDIDGASKILEHMKSQHLSINEVVFNMLVKGHMKTGDIEGAKVVMETMRGSELEPSAETYKTLMCGYAETGDINSIQQVLTSAETDGVILHPRHLFEVIFDLVQRGHSEGMTALLPQIRMTRSYNQDAANCMFRLVTHGYDDAALQVYMTMEKPSSPEQQGHLGRVLLRNMVMKERPLEKVLEFMERLKKEGLSTDTINMLGLWAIKFNKPDYTLQIFRKMKEQDVPVKPHYFWPVFRSFQATGPREGVYEALKELAGVVNSEQETVVTLYRYATVAMQYMGDDVDTIVTKLQEAGFSERSVNCIRVMLSMSEGNLAQTVNIASCGDTFLSPSLIKAELPLAYNKSNDAVSAMELLRLAEEGAGEKLFDVNSSVLGEILQNSSLDTQQVEQLLDAYIEKGLHVFAGTKSKLTKALEKFDESSHLVEKLNKVALAGGEERRATRQMNLPAKEFMKKSLPELEKMLEEARSHNTNTKAVEKWLLSKYCSAGDVERAMELKASLDSQGFVYNAELLRQLGYLAARTQADLGLALKYKQQMETQHPDFSTYVSLVLHVAQLQLKKGALQDALQTLRDYGKKHGAQLKNAGFSENYVLAEICESMLATCREHCPPEASTEVVKTLFDLGYMKRGTFSMLTHPIKAHIEKEDVAGMLKILEQTVTEFGRAPMFSDIFRVLIRKEDADRLQTAVDLVTTVHGEMNVLLHLVFAFIECEKVKQAKKILETPGLRAVMSVLRDGCQRFYNGNMVKEMDQLVDITKDLFAIDRDEMLFQQIRLCAKNGDHKKALDVYASYEEQNVLPRTRTLRYLAKLLQSHDQEVPFDVPSTAQIYELLTPPTDDAQQLQTAAAEQLRADSAEEEQAIKLLKAGDIDAFISLKQKSEADGAAFSSDFLAELARIIRGDQRTFKMYTYALAEAGEVDSLLIVRQQSLPNALDHFVHQRIFNAYVNAGRVEELLDYLVENPSLLHKYLTTKGILKLAQKQPQLISKVELAVEKSNEDIMRLDVVTHLFNYYCLTDQMDKADQVLTKYPLLRDQMRVMFLCREAERQNKEAVLQKLVEAMKGTTRRRLAMPYSHLINLKCRNNDWQSALGYLREAEKDGVTVDDMWNVALLSLEEQLLNNSQPLPWKDKSATVMEGTYIEDKSATAMEGTYIEDKSATAMEGTYIEDKSATAMEGTYIEDKSATAMEGTYIEDKSATAMEGTYIEDKSATAMEGTYIEDKSATAMEGTYIEDKSATVMEGTYIEDK